MITNWEEFYNAVKQMREHQKVYFATKDFVALGNSKKLEGIIDDCIKKREREKRKAAGND
jgi:hypothetical protein